MAEFRDEKTRWQLRPFVQVVEVGEDRVLLAQLGQRVLFKTSAAPLIPAALEFLKMPRSADEIQSAFFENSPKTTQLFLQALHKQRLVMTVDEVPTGGVDGPASAWDAWIQFQGLSVSEANRIRERLGQMEIVLMTRMQPPTDFLRTTKWQRLAPLPENLQADSESVRLHIILLPATDFATLESLSARATTLQAKTIPVLLDPFGAVVGPLGGPEGRACLRCLARRMQSDLNPQSLQATPLSPALQDEIALIWPPTFWSRLDSILKDEIHKIVGGHWYSHLNRGVFVFDFLNHRTEAEDLFPVPGCECSTQLNFPAADFLVVAQ